MVVEDSEEWMHAADSLESQASSSGLVVRGLATFAQDTAMDDVVAEVDGAVNGEFIVALRSLEIP